MRKNSSNNKNNKKNDKKKDKKVKKSKKQIRAEEIQQKIKDNPEYIPTKKDSKALYEWKNLQDKNRKKEIQKGKKEIQKKNQKMVKRRTAKTTVHKFSSKVYSYYC